MSHQDKVLEKECCSKCRYFSYESPCHDQPYPEFWCAKGHWDGITSYDDLEEPVACFDWAKIESLIRLESV